MYLVAGTLAGEEVWTGIANTPLGGPTPPPPSASHPFLDPLLSNTRQTVLGNEMQENLLDEAPDKIPLGRYLPLSVLPAWTVNPPPGGELATFSAMRTRIHY